jgi:Domain of unknown function (DUF4157)
MRAFAEKPKAAQEAKSPQPTIFNRAGLGRRPTVSSLSNPQPVIGNQATLRALQPKLAINAPGSIGEQEADRAAEQIIRMPNPTTAGNSSVFSRRSQLQRPVDPGGGLEEAPPIVHEVLLSPGRPLDAATRAFMEPRFGHDFSQVRVHDDAQAAQSARSINARAYTVGQRVVLSAGEYAPGTSRGHRLLAHELAHVVQQYSSGVSGFRTSHDAPTVVHRQTPSGGQGSGGQDPPRARIVYLDNDVLGAVADGNKPVAEALKRMRATGAIVRIALYNYVEASHGEPVRAGARMLIVKELGIEIDLGAGLASRASTYEQLSTGKRVEVQTKDMPMIAAVRAAGPHAELWSLDGGVNKQAPKFGVRMAREGWFDKKAPQPVRVGLDNVGLQAWEIGSDGTPIRRGQLLAGARVPSGTTGSGPSGGSTPKPAPPAPVTPSVGTGGVKGMDPGGTPGSRSKAGSTAAGSMGGGGPSGLSSRAIGGALGGVLIAGASLAQRPLKEWFAENYLQKKWAAGARAMVEKAFMDSSWKYDLSIMTRYSDIERARAQGRQVILHVIVDTEWIQTDFGPAQISADVVRHGLVFEGETPFSWPSFKEEEQGHLERFFNAPKKWHEFKRLEVPLL